MTAGALDQQITKYLTDVHSIEQQALAQMRAAPGLTEDPSISAAFAAHLIETERHERRVHERLRARGASPATVKDLAGTVLGKGFVTFARSQPDTSGKLVAHAFSYEHMELAAYVLLRHIARASGDEVTAEMAQSICAEEERMGERLAALFDAAAAAALRERNSEHLQALLDGYLEDAHAIEAQALVLLGRAPSLAGEAELASAYAEHRAETERHMQLLERRLAERGDSPSRLKDAAMRVGALNWGLFFAAQPDTPVKLAAFAYAFEHLEIASYELLARVAGACGDTVAQELAGAILDEERAAAERIRGLFERAVDVSLADRRIAV